MEDTSRGAAEKVLQFSEGGRKAEELKEKKNRRTRKEKNV